MPRRNLPREPVEEEGAELHRLREEFAEVRAQLRRYQLLIEPEIPLLSVWPPTEAQERLAGWLFPWVYPVQCLLKEIATSPNPAEVAEKKLMPCVSALICQLAVEGRHGVRLPWDPTDPEGWTATSGMLNRLLPGLMVPCAVCAESRVGDVHLIIPASDGGSEYGENLIALCPTHAQLFERDQLSAEEWEALRHQLDGRPAQVRVYADQVRLPRLAAAWQTEASRTH